MIRLLSNHIIKKGFLIWIFFLLFWYAFASSSNDCQLFSSDYKVISEQAIKKLGYEYIFPAEALEQSLLNLKTYCCKSVDPSDDYCKKNKNNLPQYYPESAFLYDHLIDVWIRRLNAFDNLTYWLQSDIIWKEWRDRIIKNSESKDWTTAKIIFDKYQKYRTVKNPIITADSSSIINNETVFKSNYNNIDQVSLFDKYISLCFITKKIYEPFKGSVWIGNPSDSNSYYSKCLKLIKNRISQENTYVQSLIIRKSNKLLIDVNKAYMNDSFVKKSLMSLQSRISDIKNLFKTIVKQAPTSQSCSK